MPYKDPADKAAYHRRWRLAHPDWEAQRWARDKVRIAARNKKSRARHFEKRAAEKAAYQKAYPERNLMAGLRHRLKVRAEMIAAYGGLCACCGETEPMFLTLDHIHGGGSAERRATRTHSNQNIVARLRREGWPKDDFQLLCWNCQYATYRGSCPHRVIA